MGRVFHRDDPQQDLRCGRKIKNPPQPDRRKLTIPIFFFHYAGVVGYGDIGRDCARTAKQAFNMKIIALRRRPSLSDGDGIADEVYGSDQLHEMMGKCDYVLCAAPLTPETKHMFNADTFRAMKNSTVFLNIGRGTSRSWFLSKLPIALSAEQLSRLNLYRACLSRNRASGCIGNWGDKRSRAGRF